MPNFAQIVIAGHLGRDIQIRALPDGTPVGDFSVAVTTGYGAKKTTSWYNVVLFGKAATALQPHLTKGRAVLVAGEPQIREWETAAKEKRSQVEIRATRVALLSKGEPQAGQPEADKGRDDSGGGEDVVIPF